MRDLRSFFDRGQAAQRAVDRVTVLQRTNEEGRKAYHDGLTLDQCPYPADALEARGWRGGWKLALESVEGE